MVSAHLLPSRDEMRLQSLKIFLQVRQVRYPPVHFLQFSAYDLQKAALKVLTLLSAGPLHELSRFRQTHVK